jgi:glycosyltransferase involved in cell wall biosynthesis
VTKLIAQMVVRNEADRYLEEVLQHLSTLADEIVITDDASTDNSVEVCRKYTENVYENDVSLFSTNESTLRTGAWANLCNHASEGDVILCIDADEKLFVTRHQLDELYGMKKYDVFGITFYHMWNNTHFRVDKAWAPVVSSRMFRFYEGGQFRSSRLACGSEPTYVQRLIGEGKFFMQSGLMMQHLGYVRDEDKQAKYDRYMSIDKGEFHARKHLQSILDSSPTLVPWKQELTKNLQQPRKVIHGNHYSKRRNWIR